MAQFQTVQPPPLSSKLQLPKQPVATPLQSLSLHIGSEITLELASAAGPPVGGLTIKVKSHIGEADKVVKIAVTGVTATRQTFTVKALGGGSVWFTAEDSTGVRKAGFMLTAGVFKNHSENGFPLDVDLLANVSRGANGHVINEIRKLLKNDANNLFNQKAAHNTHADPKIGDMTCGMVCNERSAQLFGLVSPLNYNQPYHEPLKLKQVRQRTDVKYKPATIQAVKAKIIALLKAGTPVRVAVLDDPINMWPEQGKLIAWRYGGHTVVIVGYSAATASFLYVDTWPGGSQLKYNGGISDDPKPDKCVYLGMLTDAWDPARVLVAGDNRFNMLRSRSDTEGSFHTAAGTFLEVVAGP